MAEAEAFQLGSERYTVLKTMPADGASRNCGGDSSLAFHFILDNSGSMGGNSEAALQAFSPLVDMATAPCSESALTEHVASPPLSHCPHPFVQVSPCSATRRKCSAADSAPPGR